MAEPSGLEAVSSVSSPGVRAPGVNHSPGTSFIARPNGPSCLPELCFHSFSSEDSLPADLPDSRALLAGRVIVM